MSTHTNGQDVKRDAQRTRGQQKARSSTRQVGGISLTLADEVNRYRDENGKLRYRDTTPRACGCEGHNIPHRGECLKCGKPVSPPN